MEEITIIKEGIKENLEAEIIEIQKYDNGDYPIFQISHKNDNLITQKYNLPQEKIMSATPSEQDTSHIEFHIKGYDENYYYNRMKRIFSPVQPIRGRI